MPDSFLTDKGVKEMEVGFDEVLRQLESGDAWQKATDEDERAMAIACATIEIYGDLDAQEWAKFRKDGKIWRDHCSYQAALAALRMSKKANHDR
jgi:hypothetical protein